MKSFKPSAIGCIALCTLLLTGCDVTTPSQVQTGDIQIKDVMKTAIVDPVAVNSDTVETISTDYARNGSGPMRLVVPYAPGNPLNKAAAQAQGQRYEKAFTDHGINDFRVSYTATVDPSAEGVISYMALAAEPPRHCRHIAGFYGTETLAENIKEENIGCEMKMDEARMIARPADLLGVSGVPDDDAKRQGTVVDKYRSGVPNPALTGLSTKSSGG
jgi:type IV pilus biogenesis protein CpaD/CtpE